MCPEKWCNPLQGRRRPISYAALPCLFMKAASASVRTRPTAPSPAAANPGDSLPFSRLRVPHEVPRAQPRVVPVEADGPDDPDQRLDGRARAG